VVEWVADTPIVLVGEPRAVRGEVRLRNDGADREVLRGGLLEAGDGTPSRLRPVKLRAGETRTVPLSLRLDPTTPPGEYRRELDVGGLRREAVLRVVERVDLRIEPSSLRIENRPGQSVTRTVLLTNRGNVELTIERIDPVVVDDVLLDCRILRRALAALDADTAGFSEFLDELVRQAKLTLEETGLLPVRLAGGTVVLQPGEATVVDLEVDVPSGLDPRAEYRGGVGVFDTTLRFTLFPVGEVVRARRARRGRSTSTEEAPS
jgi:hypothetical protein